MDQWLTARAVALLWGVTYRTVLNEVQRGNLPATRIAGRIRIKAADAEAYAAARKITADDVVELDAIDDDDEEEDA